MRLSFLVAAAVVLSSGVAARAAAIPTDSVAGSSVTGALYFDGGTINYFNPANGFVPAGYGNSGGTTTTIGPGIEFGFQDHANTDTANFTGTMLTIKDVSAEGALPFEMDFTDTAFTGFEQIGDLRNYSSTFSGDTLKVFFSGTDTADTYTVKLDDTTSVTPEPSSMAMFGSGLLGIAGVIRRRVNQA